MSNLATKRYIGLDIIRALVCLGAVITILTLAVDPFAQQLIQYEPRLVYSDGSDQAAIPRAERYSKGDWFYIDTAIVCPIALGRNITYGPNNAPVAFVDADFAMQSAVLFGLAEPVETVTQQLAFKCSSGNCNWSGFESLAVCSVCNNVTRLLRKEDKGEAVPMWMDFNHDQSFVELKNVTSFELPNGLSIDNGLGNKRSGGMLMTSHGTGNASETNSLQDVDTLIWAMTIIRVPPSLTDDLSTWPDIAIEAMECALYYCVNRYNSQVRNGTLQEQVTPNTELSRSSQSWQSSVTPFQDLRRPASNFTLDTLPYSEPTSSLARTSTCLRLL